MTDLKVYVEETKKEVESVMLGKYDELKTVDGKMLRGVLAVLVSDSLNGNHKKAVDYGASVEFIHQGSLYHDDVLDSHLDRRGKPTAFMMHGIKKALLMGDMHFTLANKLAAEHGQKEAFDISSSMENVLKGVMKELTVGNILESIIRGDVEENIYMKVIDMKTATLFACAAKLGSMASTDDKQVIADFNLYGLYIGEAFQIADDMVDIIKMADGKKDISLESVTALIPCIIRYNKDFVKRLPFKLLTGKIGVEFLMNAMTEIDITDKMRSEIKELLGKANKIIGNNSELLIEGNILEEYGIFCVNKMLAEVDEKL